jgi:hypothetical protein
MILLRVLPVYYLEAPPWGVDGQRSSGSETLLRHRDEIKVVDLGRVGWGEGVVPFAVEVVPGQR